MGSVIDYSGLDIETVKSICLVKEKNCVTVPEILILLSGHESTFEFFADPVLADIIFDFGKQEMIDLSMVNDVYYYDYKEEATYEAYLCVIHYKMSKLQKARLVVVACLKEDYYEPGVARSDMLNFVRMYHLPCKLFLIYVVI